MNSTINEYIQQNYNRNLEHNVTVGDKTELLNVVWLDQYNAIVCYKSSEFVMYPVKSYGTIKRTYHFEHLTIDQDKVKSIWFDRRTSLKAHKDALKAFIAQYKTEHYLSLIG